MEKPRIAAKESALCMCKQTKPPPYCDDTRQTL